MTYVNDKGYLERKTKSGKRRRGEGKSSKRNWWMVKASGKGACIPLNNISFPTNMLGKKVVFKVEEK